MSSPPWSPTREPHGRYEELAQVDEYGTMRPPPPNDDVSDQASDDALVHHDDSSGWAQTPAWNICLNAAMYCAVPLSMPATLAAGGWFWGTVFFAYATSATYWTGLVIGRVYLEHPRLATYPAMASEAFHNLALERTNGDARVARNWRTWSRRAVKITQFATFYLDTVTQMIYVAQYFAQLDLGWFGTGAGRDEGDEIQSDSPAGRPRLCQWAWVLVVWAVSVPVMQIPTFHASRWVIVPAVAVLAVSVALFLYEVAAVVKPWSCEPGPSFGGVTLPSAMVSLGNMAYAYGGHGVFPESLREMREPHRWPSVMRWMYLGLVPAYVICAIVGYAGYGRFAQANINLNFPKNWVNGVSITLQLLQCYYLIFYTNVVLVLMVETRWGIDPTKTWRPRTSLPVIGSTSPAVARLLFRTAFLGTQVALAEWFITSASTDVILDLQALTGSVGMAAMTFFIPSALAWGLLPRNQLSASDVRWCVVNIVGGAFIALTGVITATMDLVSDGGTDGVKGGRCELRYTYAPNDPGDPCFVSGINGAGGHPLLGEL